jgi:hypothetical protein
MHDRGRTFTGEFVGVAHRVDGWPLPPGTTRPVLARLSKGAGTRGGRPDILGLAIRLAGPGGEPWDLTLSSCGRSLLGRVLPLPARAWSTTWYGTLATYHDGQHTWQLLAALPPSTPDGRGPGTLDRRAGLHDLVTALPLRFGLALVSRRGRGRVVGHLLLDRPLPVTAPQPAFDSVLHLPAGLQMRPAWLARLRRHAYRGSRQGRGAPGASASAATPAD